MPFTSTGLSEDEVALVPANGGYDPLFRRFPIAANRQDGAARWSYPATLTLVNDDPGNPFGTPTLRVDGSATYGGILVHLAEMDLDPEDVISFGMLMMVPAGNEIRMTVAFRLDSTSLGTATSGYVTGDGGIEWRNIAAREIPATCNRIDVYAQRNAGSDDVDIYGIWIIHGSTISQERALAESYRAASSAYEWRRRYSGEPTAFNTGRLTSWWAALARNYNATADNNAVLMCMGDSVTNSPVRYLAFLSERLWADFDNGGVGWVGPIAELYTTWGFQTKMGSVTRAGTWTETDHATPGKGLNLADATSTAAADQYTITWTGTAYKIHYLKHTGGGTFKHQIDSGGWSADIDTDDTEAAAVVSVTGLTSEAHSLEVYANGAGVTLLGFEFYDRDATNGVIVHRCGNGGARSDHWALAAETQIWQDQLAEVAPDAILIDLGTNENQSAALTSAYSEDFDTLIAGIKAALPNADVLLVVPHHTTPDGSSEDFDTLRRMLRRKAAANGYALIDLSMVMYNVDHSDALGLMTDAVHPNADGGAVCGAELYRWLRLY